jgi:predicted 2-oxoglutarate/Fe(II)-dependent dioxygenase YbiX
MIWPSGNIIVSPFHNEQIRIPAGKLVLYAEEFYEITRKSGAVTRCPRMRWTG